MHRYVAIALSFCLVGSAPAVTTNFIAALNGAQANAGAGTGSPGTGSATMTYDDNTQLFSWNVSWAGLDGNVTLAHFHGPATPAQNAGVQVGISVAANPSVGSTALTAAQATQLHDGLWYINVHTDLFPAGEIRGQVLLEGVVPTERPSWSRIKALYD
jgi:hypothetical protein